MDKILYMKSGKIEWNGNYQEIQNQPFYSKLLIEKDLNNNINEEYSDNNSYDTIEVNDKIVKLTKEEEQSHKGIKYSVYLDYSRYMGGICFMISIIFIMCLWQANKGEVIYG